MKIKELLIMFVIIIFIVASLGLAIYNNAKVDHLNSTEEFEYKGHQYIKFDNGVVHNPECKKCIMIYD